MVSLFFLCCFLFSPSADVFGASHDVKDARVDGLYIHSLNLTFMVVFQDPRVMRLMKFGQTHGRLAQGPSKPRSIEKENTSHTVALQDGV